MQQWESQTIAHQGEEEGCRSAHPAILCEHYKRQAASDDGKESLGEMYAAFDGLEVCLQCTHCGQHFKSLD